ncbi:MAG: trypsin-like peptidase domain-containing protein [Thomasclavelia ramosa]
MEPKTISEQLMFSTVRLETNDGASGTGFFYYFDVDKKSWPVLITNKHVVNYNPDESMTFYLHLKNGNNSSNSNYKVTYQCKWIFHSSKDLCFCFVKPLFEEVKRRTGKEVFVLPVDDSIVATSQKIEELSAVEELVMVGYPIGLWDENNNFPIFRRGYTASHPAIDFNETGIGLVDMACFPGSSGSPIFILNENGYSDKNGNTYLGSHRLIFIGILFAGPQYTAKGKLITKTIPTNQDFQSLTPIMTNLGYYIKVTELQEFKEYIKSNQ